MTHVVRAWRTSRTIRLFVLVVLLGAVTQLVLSRRSRPGQDPHRQTKTIGRERLVSVEPLPEMGGEACVPLDSHPEPAASLQQERTIAAVQQLRSAPPTSASFSQQSPLSAEPTTSSPPRPSDATRSEVAKRSPIST